MAHHVLPLLCIGGALHGSRKAHAGESFDDDEWRYVRVQVRVDDAVVSVWCVDVLTPLDLLHKLLEAVARCPDMI